MSLLGLHQTIVATDGKPPTNQSTVVAETDPGGLTLDTHRDASRRRAPAGTQVRAVRGRDAPRQQGRLATPRPARNTPIAFGGMLTFLTVGRAATVGGAAR